MNWIPAIYIITCAVLWRLGGWDKAKWSGYRDVLIPLLLALWYLVNLRIWWIFPVEFIVASIIRMGYGAWDPEHDDKPSWLASITHDQEGSKIRMIYGVITAFAIGIFPAVITGHYIRFVLYIIMNGSLEYILNCKKVKDTIVETLNGAGRASVILWLK
jgi:hypothetical protein